MPQNACADGATNLERALLSKGEGVKASKKPTSPHSLRLTGRIDFQKKKTYLELQIDAQLANRLNEHEIINLHMVTVKQNEK